MYMSWAAWEQWYNFIYNYYVYLEEICSLKRVPPAAAHVSLEK